MNLEFILDYIYDGEVKIYQEQLDSFLEGAKKLEIKGLIGQEGVAEETYQEIREEVDFPADEAKQLVRIQESKEVVTTTRKQYVRTPSSEASKIDVTSLTTEEIEDKIQELHQRIDGMSACMVCDYTSKFSSNVRKHVEKHIDGLSYSCNLCNKEFRFVNSLNSHKSLFHRTKLSGPQIL